MKSVVEAGELRRRWKDRLRRGDEGQCLWDVQGRKVGGGTQFVQHLWRDELVRAKMRASVHHAVAHRHGGAVRYAPGSPQQEL